MSMKDWLQRLQPFQIYIVLTLSIVYFLVQLFLSHITHALTLLVASYHMLCNIIALTGSILTIKVIIIRLKETEKNCVKLCRNLAFSCLLFDHIDHEIVFHNKSMYLSDTFSCSSTFSTVTVRNRSPIARRKNPYQMEISPKYVITRHNKLMNIPSEIRLVGLALTS